MRTLQKIIALLKWALFFLFHAALCLGDGIRHRFLRPLSRRRDFFLEFHALRQSFDGSLLRLAVLHHRIGPGADDQSGGKYQTAFTFDSNNNNLPIS